MGAFSRVFLALLAFKASVKAVDPEHAPTCEPLKSDMCRTKDNIPLYNSTGMPNFANHKSQADANYNMATFFPLIQTGCAPELQFFLCSVYVPMCVDHSPQKLIGPCRPLCERVRKKCEPELDSSFNIKWPQVLNCSKFPETNVHEHMCIDVPSEHAPFSMGLPPSSLNSLQSNPLFMEKVKQQLANNHGDDNTLKPYKNYMEILKNNLDKLEPAKGVNLQCGDLKKSFKYVHSKRKDICIPKCGLEITFSKENKANTNSLIVALAAFCFGLSLLTFLAFMANSCWDLSAPSTASNFAHQSPAFLALTFVGYSFGYLTSQIGLYHNPDWLCVGELQAQEGQRSQPCIVIFLFVYFFGLAASCWWTVVAFSWALAQYFQPSKANMATISKLCHFYAWGLPALFTLASIILHNIEADELTSVCLPGALQDDSSLLTFVVVPEGVQLVLGSAMYLSGLCLAFFCGEATTSEQARGKSEAKHLRSLRLRYSLYGFVFTCAKMGVFATWVYEYANRRQWLYVSSKDLPDVNIFWLRITLSHLVGILMPWWIVTSQTKLTCFSLWKSNKPTNGSQTNQFPSVAYRPQATEMVNMTNTQPLIGQRRDYL